MDLAQLATLLAVARRGSFSAGASEVHLSQPGASRQIRRLEREVGAALFAREGGVRLTPAGERVAAFARATLDGHAALLAALRDQQPGLRGRLAIAASTTPGEFVVPELVAGFQRRHPAVEPHVAISDSAGVEAAVRDRHVDLGFAGAKLGGRGLRYRPVVDDEIVLAVPADHPFARRGEIDLAELAGQPFLEREGGSGTAASVRRALAARGLSLPPYRTVMTLGSSPAIVSAVEHGLGLGWVSSLALACRSRRRVVGVRLAGVPIRRTLWLVDDPGRDPSPLLAAFVHWVGEWRRNPCAAPLP